MGNLISKFSRMLNDKYNLNLNLIWIENSILCDLNHSVGIVQRKLMYISIYCKTIQEYSQDHKFIIFCFALLLQQILDNFQNQGQFSNLLVLMISSCWGVLRMNKWTNRQMDDCRVAFATENWPWFWKLSKICGSNRAKQNMTNFFPPLY